MEGEGREKEGGREGGRRQREAGGERGKGLREGEREGERYEKENGSGRRVKGREIENEEKWSINYAKSTNRHRFLPSCTLLQKALLGLVQEHFLTPCTPDKHSPV